MLAASAVPARAEEAVAVEPAVTQKPPEAPAQAEPVRVEAAAGKGITVTSADGTYAMNLAVRLNFRDTVRFGGDSVASNEINLKTLRLFFQGHALDPALKYRVQLAFGGNDFDADTATPVFDAFVEWTKWRDLNVRVGQFFVPFDRLRTIREFALHMVDRPQVIGELTLDRDVGVALSSADLFGLKKLAYTVGVFGGEGRNRFGGATPATGLLYVGRFSVAPLGTFDDDVEGDVERKPAPRVAIGVAGAYNRGTNRPRGTTGTAFRNAHFDYAHAAADLVFKWHGLYVQGEVVSRGANQPYVASTIEDVPTKEWSRAAWGYVTQAGYMLNDTVELTGRWSELKLHGSEGHTDPALEKLVKERGREVAAGANVYLKGHRFKIQADAVHQFGNDPLKARSQVRTALDVTF